MQHVRRAAVSALSTAAHNKPALVKDLLPTLLPLLYDQTVVKVHQLSLLYEVYCCGLVHTKFIGWSWTCFCKTNSLQEFCSGF